MAESNASMYNVQYVHRLQSVCLSTSSEHLSCMASRSVTVTRRKGTKGTSLFDTFSHLQGRGQASSFAADWPCQVSRFQHVTTWAKLAAMTSLSQDTSAPLKERCSISWRTLSRQRSIFKRWNCNSETSTNLATQRIEITKSDSNNLEHWDRHS